MASKKNNIAIYGLFKDANFQRACACAKLITDTYSHLLAFTTHPFTECAWSEIFFSLQQLHSTKLTPDSTATANVFEPSNVLVILNETTVFTLEQFADWAKVTYAIEDSKSVTEHEEAARASYVTYLSNPKHEFVYFDVSIAGIQKGRLVFELFSDICPVTCANFKALCTGEKGYTADGKTKLSYVNSLFHRVQVNGYVQGGDIVNGSGAAGASIYGANFQDENFIVKHSRRGVLCMANSGLHSNGSQFCVALRAISWMNERYVAFGQLIEGEALLKDIGAVATFNQRPTEDVVITACGVLLS